MTFRRRKKGDRIPAADWNALLDLVEKLANLRVSAPLELRDLPGGFLLSTRSVSTSGSGPDGQYPDTYWKVIAPNESGWGKITLAAEL